MIIIIIIIVKKYFTKFILKLTFFKIKTMAYKKNKNKKIKNIQKAGDI